MWLMGDEISSRVRKLPVKNRTHEFAQWAVQSNAAIKHSSGDDDAELELYGTLDTHSDFH